MGVILGCRSARAAVARPRGAGKGLGVGGGDKRDDNGFFLEAPRGGEGEEGEEEGEAFHGRPLVEVVERVKGKVAWRGRGQC